MSASDWGDVADCAHCGEAQVKIRLVTVVWGQEYVDTFIRTGLRSLLSKGNVADLAAAHEVVHTIFTTHPDAEALEQAPAFARLRESVDVRLSLFDPSEIDTQNYGEHGTFWWRAMDLARRNGEVLFFIIPDLLYANGTLVRWAQRFAEGKRAIFTIGPQVVLETVLPELETRFPGQESPYDLDRDRLLDLLGRHLHPLHAAMRHDARRRPAHPEYDLRLVAGRGMVIREIVSHPFCVDPGFYSALKHYGPEDHLDTLAFEPCSTVSVEPMLKRVHGYYRPWPLDEVRLSNLAGWWDCFTTAACERESRHPFELARQEDEEWRAGWSRAVAAGSFYRSQVVAAGRLYQLFVALRTQRYFRAANILAAAVYAGRLRRRIGVRRRAVILVPTDEALAGADGDKVRALLQPGREKEFLDFISDHVLLGKDEVGFSRRLTHLTELSPAKPTNDEELVTAHGSSAAPLLSFARSAGEPFGVGPFTVYPVDRVVWRQAAEAHAAAERRRAATSSSKPMSTPPPDLRTMGGTFVVTHWARRSIFHRTLYYALHIPFVEPFIALMFPFYFKVPIKNRLRPYSIVHRLRRVARQLGDPRSAFGLTARAVKRIPVVGGAACLALHGLRHAKRRAQPHVALVRRVVELIRRDGVGLAMRKIRKKTIGSASLKDAITWLTVGAAELEKLRQVRGYRALKAVEAVLVDCETKMGGVAFRSMPLVYVRQLLARHKLDGTRGSNAARALLLKLVEKHPSWAEPWLELGFMYEDAGADAEALRCFERAMRGRRAADLAPSDPHPCAVAAASRGRLLMAMGRQDEALAAFARVTGQDPGQKVAAAQYAGLLRRLGNINGALVYYGEGMYYQECRWCLPPAPRDAADVDLRYLAAEAASELSAHPTPAPAFAPAQLIAERSWP
jgi:tetratricopeptide (TPR) repeat protein